VATIGGLGYHYDFISQVPEKALLQSKVCNSKASNLEDEADRG
jgi:hypothetical protein